MLEAEAQSAQFLVRSESGGERGKGAVLHDEARDGTVLDFDRIDARRRARKDGGDRAHQICQQVVRMYRLRQQYAAERCIPLAPPLRRVVLGRAPPGSLDRGKVRLACKAEIDDPLRLLDSVAKAVLKDRQYAPACLLLNSYDTV